MVDDDNDDDNNDNDGAWVYYKHIYEPLARVKKSGGGPLWGSGGWIRVDVNEE